MKGILIIHRNAWFKLNMLNAKIKSCGVLITSKRCLVLISKWVCAIDNWSGMKIKFGKKSTITGIKYKQNFKHLFQPLKTNKHNAKEVMRKAIKYWVYKPISVETKRMNMYLFLSSK